MANTLTRALTSDPEDRPWERAAVRIGVPVAFLAAGVLAYAISHGTATAPEIAFENHFVYAVQLFLLIFYGILLLLVPLVRAIASGELPIELTARGARFPEKAVKGSLTANQELLERLEEVEEALRSQRILGDQNAARAAEGLLDLADDLDHLRKELREALGGPRP
jgi:hypothetical protein